MVEKWKQGFDIVNTERIYHKSTPFIKKVTSEYFYKVLSYFSQVKIKPGFADFRLLDRKVVDELNKFSEKEILVRATVAWLGFKQFSLVYECNERRYGVSKYTFLRSLKLAIKSLIHYTTWPLTLPLTLSGVFLATSVLGFSFFAFEYFWNHHTAVWLGIFSFGMFLTTWPLFTIGILAIYLGRYFCTVS